MKFQPKNWEKFQHYKNRKPPWIKLHRDILDDHAFFCLPDASKAIAMYVWLFASEFQDAIIDTTIEEMIYRFRITEKQLLDSIRPLFSSGFLVALCDDSAMLAGCKHHATLEVEKEREKEEELDANSEVEFDPKKYLNLDFEEAIKSIKDVHFKICGIATTPPMKIIREVLEKGHLPNEIIDIYEIHGGDVKNYRQQNIARSLQKLRDGNTEKKKELCGPYDTLKNPDW